MKGIFSRKFWKKLFTSKKKKEQYERMNNLKTNLAKLAIHSKQQQNREVSLINTMKDLIVKSGDSDAYLKFSDSVGTNNFSLLSDRWKVDCDLKLIVRNRNVAPDKKDTCWDFYSAVMDELAEPEKSNVSVPFAAYTKNNKMIIRMIQGWDIVGSDYLTQGTTLRSN